MSQRNINDFVLSELVQLAVCPEELTYVCSDGSVLTSMANEVRFIGLLPMNTHAIFIREDGHSRPMQ